MKSPKWAILAIFLVIVITAFIVKKYFPSVEIITEDGDTVSVIDSTKIKELTVQLREITLDRDYWKNLTPETIRDTVWLKKDSIRVDTLKVYLVGADTLNDSTYVAVITEDGDSLEFSVFSDLIVNIKADEDKERFFVDYDLGQYIKHLRLKKKPVNLKSRMQIFLQAGISFSSYDRITSEGLIKKETEITIPVGFQYIRNETDGASVSMDLFGSEFEIRALYHRRIF